MFEMKNYNSKREELEEEDQREDERNGLGLKCSPLTASKLISFHNLFHIVSWRSTEDYK